MNCIPRLLDRGRAAILDLDLDALQALPAQRQAYRPLRRFPTSSFDLSIVAPAHTLVADLENKLRQLAGDSLVSLAVSADIPAAAGQEERFFPPDPGR